MAERRFVVVCLAPDDLMVDVDAVAGRVTVDERRSALSAADGAALEHALRLGEIWESEVVAFAVGPPQINASLQEAAALGADIRRIDSVGGVHEECGGARALSPAEIAGDPARVAKQLATEIRRLGSPELVICGDRSSRHGIGTLPGELAAELALPQALGLVSLQVSTDGTLMVERRLDSGWRERIVVDRPAVLSVEAAGVRVRRAPLEALVACADFEIPAVPASSLTPPHPAHPVVQLGAPLAYRPPPRRVEAPSGDAHQRLLSITGSEQTAAVASRVIGPLTASEAADEFLSYLRQNGYVEG